MKKTKIISCILAAVMMVLVITACSSNNDDKQDEISMYDLQKAMLGAAKDLPDMTTVNSSSDDAASLFSYLSDMDYDKTNGFFLAYATEGDSYEIAAVRVKDASDIKDAEDSLKKHVEGRVNLYKTYAPDQTDRAKSAEVFTNGRFAVLVMCDDQPDVKTAFENFINPEP